MSDVDTLVTSIFSGVVIALLVAMFVAQRRQVDQLRREMADMRTELKADIAAVRTELRGEIAELRRALSAVEKDTAMLVGRLLPEDEVLARIANRPEPVST